VTIDGAKAFFASSVKPSNWGSRRCSRRINMSAAFSPDVNPAGVEQLLY
jgi:hypothetical protein